MTVIAFDLAASSAIAHVNANTRTSTSGHPWTIPTSGAFTSATAWKIAYGDGTADGRCKCFYPQGTRGLIYLPVAMSGTLWRAHMRLGYTVGVRCGVGFADANGNGYFAGYYPAANQHEIVRVAGSTGAITQLASASSLLGAAPFVRAWQLEYTPTPRLLRAWFDGVLVATTPASSSDATYTPTFPALWVESSSMWAVSDVLFEGA